MRRFECMSEEKYTQHNKFWEVEIKGTELKIRYGVIGAIGCPNYKNFEDAETAQKECDNLIREKLRKGYKEVATRNAEPSVKAGYQEFRHIFRRIGNCNKLTDHNGIRMIERALELSQNPEIKKKIEKYNQDNWNILIIPSLINKIRPELFKFLMELMKEWFTRQAKDVNEDHRPLWFYIDTVGETLRNLILVDVKLGFQMLKLFLSIQDKLSKENLMRLIRGTQEITTYEGHFNRPIHQREKNEDDKVWETIEQEIAFYCKQNHYDFSQIKKWRDKGAEYHEMR